MDRPAMETLSEQIETALAAAELYVAVEITSAGLELVGEVDSEQNRQAALDVARSLAVPAGVALSDAITVEQFLPEDVFADTEAGESATDDYDREHEGEEPLELELAPDFAGGVGTTDTQRVVEEGETYFAPTDPVVRPVDSPQELEVLGGFEATAMDEVMLPDGPEDDDQVADRIREALRLDAETTDLTVGVLVQGERVVLYGQVPTLDDAESAQAVAADAADGRDVEEQFKIVGDLA